MKTFTEEKEEKMGSICWIETDPRKWRAYKSGLRLKEEFGGEELLKITFGSFDDECLSEMVMYMRPSIYEKVLSGEYEVATESKWRRCLVLIDKERKKIPPIGAFCY